MRQIWLALIVESRSAEFVVFLDTQHFRDLELNNITEIHEETFISLNNIKDL
jgi:hypothetical protein